MWLDGRGMQLSDYPRPSVTVDVALLTVIETGTGTLPAVLVAHRPGGDWALPGTFLRIDERLDAAALRALRDKVGVTGEHPRQLRVFDDPGRDPRGRVVTVAHVDLVHPARLAGRLTESVRLAPLVAERFVLPDGQERLAFDHDLITAEAMRWARRAYAERPDPARLLGETFTLNDLRRLHGAIRGGPLQKDTFRRRMEPFLVPTGERSSGSVGRPAQLYRRRDNLDN